MLRKFYNVIIVVEFRNSGKRSGYIKRALLSYIVLLRGCGLKQLLNLDLIVSFCEGVKLNCTLVRVQIARCPQICKLG